MSQDIINKLKKMSNKELLDEYNYIRNKIDGILEGGYGRFELYYLEEILREMDKREEEKMMINVELTGRTTFYSVDIDDKNYTVEEQYDANSESYEHTIYFNDEVTGGQEEVTDADEREEVIRAIEMQEER